MFRRHRCVVLDPAPPRDLLAEHIGDRLHVALTGDVQLSGVVTDVSPGEVALAMVRVVTGDHWQAAATGTAIVERSRVVYWQHLAVVTEPAPAASMAVVE